MADQQVLIKIDSMADAAYIKLSDLPVDRTVQVTDDVLIDLDDMNMAVGIEVLRLAAEIPYQQLCTRFHIHSDVVEIVRSIRPSVQAMFLTSSPDGTSQPARTLQNA